MDILKDFKAGDYPITIKLLVGEESCFSTTFDLKVIDTVLPEQKLVFTQWDSISVPKIMAKVDGEYKRIFGWEIDANGEEYRSFLRSFIAELRHVLERLGIKKYIFSYFRWAG